MKTASFYPHYHSENIVEEWSVEFDYFYHYRGCVLVFRLPCPSLTSNNADEPRTQRHGWQASDESNERRVDASNNANEQCTQRHQRAANDANERTTRTNTTDNRLSLKHSRHQQE